VRENFIDFFVKKWDNITMRELIIKSETHGTHKVLLDSDDYDRVTAMGKWYISKNRNLLYARKGITINGKDAKLYLHRFVLNAPKGKMVDHINHNTLDNRKENLRLCTHAENLRNCRPRTDGYKGVRQRRGEYTWCTEIVHNQKYYYVGTHITPEEAALAYDKKAKELHGEFARLNFPSGLTPELSQKIQEGRKAYKDLKRSLCKAEKYSNQRGVEWSKKPQKWLARISIGGVRKFLGYFKTEQEAISARVKAEKAKLAKHPIP